LAQREIDQRAVGTDHGQRAFDLDGDQLPRLAVELAQRAAQLAAIGPQARLRLGPRIGKGEHGSHERQVRQRHPAAAALHHRGLLSAAFAAGLQP
jgi:hypothetical protein